MYGYRNNALYTYIQIQTYAGVHTHTYIYRYIWDLLVDVANNICTPWGGEVYYLLHLPKGYRPRTAKLFFDNNESTYGLWEVKFLGYLRIQHLHQMVLSPTDQSDDMDFVEKNAIVFTNIWTTRVCHLIMRVARDNGRKAWGILWEHYLSKGKPKVISLYTELTSLRRLESASISKSREYF